MVEMTTTNRVVGRSSGNVMCQKRLPAPGAVDESCLVEVPGNAHQPGDPDDHKERDAGPVIHRDQGQRGQRGVSQPEDLRLACDRADERAGQTVGVEQQLPDQRDYDHRQQRRREVEQLEYLPATKRLHEEHAPEPSEMIHLGTVVPSTKIAVTRMPLRNSLLLSNPM